MSDNPIETASAELQKWLDTLQKLMDQMKSAKLAEGKAQLEASRHDEMMKKLDGIKDSIKNSPESPAKNDLLKGLDGAKNKLNEINPDLKPDAPKLGAHRKVGDDLGWTKGEKGWKNQEGLGVKDLKTNVKMPSVPLK